jgi:hypothetical protein
LAGAWVNDFNGFRLLAKLYVEGSILIARSNFASFDACPGNHLVIALFLRRKKTRAAHRAVPGSIERAAVEA